MVRVVTVKSPILMLSRGSLTRTADHGLMRLSGRLRIYVNSMLTEADIYCASPAFSGRSVRSEWLTERESYPNKEGSEGPFELRMAELCRRTSIFSGAGSDCQNEDVPTRWLMILANCISVATGRHPRIHPLCILFTHKYLPVFSRPQSL